MKISLINTTEILLLPLWLILIYAAAYAYRNTYYKKNNPLRRYFIPALSLRLLGTFLTAAMYEFYYGGGDVTLYFIGVRDIFNAFVSNPILGLEMIFNSHDNYSPEALQALTYHRFFLEESTAMVIHVGGALSIPALGSYLGTAFLFGIIAFWGEWRLLKVFYDIYPNLHKSLAIAILFVPSIWFWGTGVMKEPLTLGPLGILFYALYNIFIKGRKIISSVLLLLLSVYILASVKAYVLLALAPAMGAWIFWTYRSRIPNKPLRILSTPIFLGLMLILGYGLLIQMGNVFQRYALENVLQTANQTQWWLKESTQRDGGTSYDLGEIDPTPVGLLKVFPKAVNVALFRPYFWETRKVINIPMVLESGFAFMLFLYTLYRAGPFRFVKWVLDEPIVLMSLIFVIIFGFAVGFSTINYGALVRYRIPCLPFFFAAMLILIEKANLRKAARLSTSPLVAT